MIIMSKNEKHNIDYISLIHINKLGYVTYNLFFDKSTLFEEK